MMIGHEVKLKQRSDGAYAVDAAGEVSSVVVAIDENRKKVRLRIGDPYSGCYLWVKEEQLAKGMAAKSTPKAKDAAE